MNRQPARDEPVEGMDVYGADGAKVGTIVALGANYLVVEKGFFFPTDYYVPLAAVARIDPDAHAVWLTVDKDEALRQGWDVAPDAGTMRRDAATDAAAAAHAVDWTGMPAASVARADVATEQADAVVVPVHEEELTATTTPVERGAVRVAKDVVAEERTLDVPVTEEQVHVQRRAVDRPAEPGEAAFEGGAIEVPVRGEDVQVQKRARVAEEIEVTKEAVQRKDQVRGTVRREQVRIVADVADGDVGVVDADEAVIEPGAAASDADASPGL